jgi:hypothetical protein
MMKISVVALIVMIGKRVYFLIISVKKSNKNEDSETIICNFKGCFGLAVKAADESDGFVEAFLCFWKLHINGILDISGFTDSCFSGLTQTQLVIDIQSALDVAFSDPSSSSTASDSVNTMALAFSCLTKQLSDFNEQSDRTSVVASASICFPSDDTATQTVVTAIINSFDLLALSNSN